MDQPPPADEPATEIEPPEARSGLDFRCAECGATMTWDPATSALACEYCGGRRAVEGGEEQILEYRLEEAGGAARGLGLETRSANCSNCGARVAFDRVDMTEHCVFCGSSQVLVEESRRNAIRPESLIPLDVGRGDAEKHFRGWLGGLWFRPNALKKLGKFEAVGVYLPFWTFDCQAESWWTAQAGYYYYVTVPTTVVRNGKSTVVMRQERRTRWEHAAGQRRDSYDDYLVLASKGVSEKLSKRLGGFETAGLVAYRPEYLSGWAAEEYQVTLEQGWTSAHANVNASQHARCSGDVPGDTQRGLQVQTIVGDIRWKHVLLPMWSLTYSYKDKRYPVLVNGQTGLVVGEAPYSWVKITLLILFIALVITAIVLVANMQ